MTIYFVCDKRDSGFCFCFHNHFLLSPFRAIFAFICSWRIRQYSKQFYPRSVCVTGSCILNSKDTKQRERYQMNSFSGNKAPLNKITLDLEKARECFALPILFGRGGWARGGPGQVAYSSQEPSRPRWWQAGLCPLAPSREPADRTQRAVKKIFFSLLRYNWHITLY